ncbi:MAG TPA: hypothetical protein VKD72_20580 [Gemmataceae bacterium]|nr:hypothetical protein [Gemmataceae bacterium]
MAADDWAVIVGVRWYPGLGNLDGPLRDASAFADWVMARNGGDVPPGNVRLILSDADDPQYGSADEARPIVTEVQAAFDSIARVSQANEKAGAGLRVGRRLYLYLAGHGYEPALNLFPLLSANQTALLMANASREAPGYHVGGRGYADWFFYAGFFDEVLLFMDCCREVDRQSAPNPPHRKLNPAPDVLEKVRGFYAWGTKWDRLTREKPLPPDNQVRGIFTATLLDGLRGAAADASGRVTAASLGVYLAGNMKKYLSAAEQADTDLGDPDYWVHPQPGTQLVIATLPTATLHVRPPAALADRDVLVLNTVSYTAVPPAASGPPAWDYQVPRGNYLVQLIRRGQPPFIDAFQPLTVDGPGEIDVIF